MQSNTHFTHGRLGQLLLLLLWLPFEILQLRPGILLLLLLLLLGM